MTFSFDTKVTYLNGEDQDPAPGNHVEEKYHGFIFMGRIGVKDPLGHHMTLLAFKHWMHLNIWPGHAELQKSVLEASVTEHHNELLFWYGRELVPSQAEPLGLHARHEVH